MIPAYAISRIRSVTIHYLVHIDGFSFLDKDGLPLWKIGFTDSSEWGRSEVLLAENEVIIGVVCKLYPGEQSTYTDF